MERRVTPPKRVTSPTWGPPPPCKQALSGEVLFTILIRGHSPNFLVSKGQRCLCNEKKSYMAAWSYGISLNVFNLLSHE